MESQHRSAGVQVSASLWPGEEPPPRRRQAAPPGMCNEVSVPGGGAGKSATSHTAATPRKRTTPEVYTGVYMRVGGGCMCVQVQV